MLFLVCNLLELFFLEENSLLPSLTASSHLPVHDTINMRFCIFSFPDFNNCCDFRNLVALLLSWMKPGKKLNFSMEVFIPILMISILYNRKKGKKKERQKAKKMNRNKIITQRNLIAIVADIFVYLVVCFQDQLMKHFLRSYIKHSPIINVSANQSYHVLISPFLIMLVRWVIANKTTVF